VVFGSGVWSLHRVQVRYRIVSEGLLPEDFRRVEMVNWAALVGLECGVKVRHTPSSWMNYHAVLLERGDAPAKRFRELIDRYARAKRSRLALEATRIRVSHEFDSCNG
jgi:hypothetical protein